MIIVITDWRKDERLETTTETFIEDIASCEWMKEQSFNVGVSYFNNEDEMNGHGCRGSIIKKWGDRECYVPAVAVNGVNLQAEYYVPHPCESFKVDMRSFVVNSIEKDFGEDSTISEYIFARRKAIHDLIGKSNIRHKNDRQDSSWDGDFDHLTDEEIKEGKL